MRRVFKTDGAAEYIGVAPRTMERWRWAGKGPRYRKVGGAVRYMSDDLDAFLAAAARSSTSDGRTDGGEPAQGGA